MKLFFDIIRWGIALIGSLILYVLVITTIPMNLFFGIFTTREGGTQFVQVLTKTDESTAAFRDEALTSLAKNSNNSDYEVQKVFIKIASPTTEEGKNLRLILTPKMIRENLLRNTSNVYDWLERKTQNLTLNLKLDGNLDTHKAIIANYFETQYASLPVCSDSEKVAALAAVNAKNMPSCQFVTPERFDTAVLVQSVISTSEYKQASTTGLEYKPELTESERASFIGAGELAKTGMFVAWVIFAVGAFILWLLFTPRFASFIVMGILFVITGMTLFSESSIVVAMVGDSLGMITSQLRSIGSTITFIGLGMVVFGVVLAISKGSKKQPVVVQKVVVSEPVKQVETVSEKKEVVTPLVVPAKTTEVTKTTEPVKPPLT